MQQPQQRYYSTPQYDYAPQYSYAPPPAYNDYYDRYQTQPYDNRYQDERYDDRYYDNRSSGYGACRMVESRIRMPDGRSQTRMVQACPDSQGRYQIVD